jgi:hypothetical protein
LKIAANLGVCDEVELIAPCIHHLRLIGVDLIVVTDVGSTDGTGEVLCEFAKDTDIRLIQLSSEEDPWGFPERMFQRTISDFSMDRLIFLDADEFWLPKSGNLKDTVELAGTDVLKVNRFNVPLVEGRPSFSATISAATYKDIYFVTDPVEDGQIKLGTDPDLTHSSIRVLPKIMVNPRSVAGIAMGCHDFAEKPDIRPVTRVPDDLVIAHFPFSTWPRFQRKLNNIRKSFAYFGHRLTDGQAWHWRRWLDLADQGKAEEEFRRQMLTQQQFYNLLASGVIQSAQQWLNRAESTATKV